MQMKGKAFLKKQTKSRMGKLEFKQQERQREDGITLKNIVPKK
jgi:hypothetical protein